VRSRAHGQGAGEYFDEVRCSDAYKYGYGLVRDFLTYPYQTSAVDWVITNPPFRLAEPFVLRGLRVARRGVAILARTVFLERSAGTRHFAPLPADEIRAVH
jgi:hypothetical protein